MKKLYKILLLFLIICISILMLNTDASFAKKKKKGPVELEITTRDGFHIKGQLDIPPKTSVKNRVPLVIFLHSIGSDHNEWGTYPSEIKTGLRAATLCFDFRGHGKSILNKRNKKVYWEYLKLEEYKKYPYDIIDVLKFIKEQYPEIDSSNIAIVGANLGANMGLMAGSLGVNAKTIIMFSPMLDYKGYDLRLSIVKYGVHPLLMMVSKQDTYSYHSSVELIKFAQGKKLLKAYPNGGNGVNLLKFQPDCKPLVTNWIKDSLYGTNSPN